MADRRAPEPSTGGSSGSGLRKRSGTAALRQLYPGYFALVMATTTMSFAFRSAGWPRPSAVFLILAVVCFAVLAVAFAVRSIVFLREVLADLSAPDRACGFFTLAGACGVLGARIAAEGMPVAAVLLGVIGCVVWVGLSYGLLLRMVLGPRTEPVLAGVSGNWFIWVVGGQSSALAATAAATAFPEQARIAGPAAVLMWSVGVVLYLIIAVLVLIRLLLFEVRPHNLAPPYWTAMGAAAITVLVAAQILSMPGEAAVVALRPVAAGVAVVLWAFGTWLIPLLALFAIGKRVLGRAKLRYRPQLWSVVFPLGMYAMAGMELGRAAGIPVIESIGRAWVWVGLAAWMFVFAALLVAMARAYLGRTRSSPLVPGRP